MWPSSIKAMCCVSPHSLLNEKLRSWAKRPSFGQHGHIGKAISLQAVQIMVLTLCGDDKTCMAERLNKPGRIHSVFSSLDKPDRSDWTVSHEIFQLWTEFVVPAFWTGVLGFLSNLYKGLWSSTFCRFLDFQKGLPEAGLEISRGKNVCKKHKLPEMCR